MATIKSTDLVNFVIKAKDDDWGYVYSAQGELYTPELAKKWGLANRSNKGYDYFVNQCSQWFGHNVVDCSGLIIEAYRSKIPKYGDKSANTLYHKCVQKGSLSTIPEVPGLCVWKSGHIGLYIGNNNVIEAGGTNVGVVLSALYSPVNSQWTNWGKLADVEYSKEDAPPEPEPVEFWLGRNLKLIHPYMKGNDVFEVQKSLLAKGFSPGKLDGIYGTKTENAVIRYQNLMGLITDGIVGKKTTAALGGEWVTDNNGNPDPPINEQPKGTITLNRQLKITNPYMKGYDVSDVQYALTQKSYSPGKIDGIYGQNTRNAVYLFQSDNGLQKDGIVGKHTIKALGGVWTG